MSVQYNHAPKGLWTTHEYLLSTIDCRLSTPRSLLLLAVRIVTIRTCRQRHRVELVSRLQDLIDAAIGERLVGRHVVVALRIALDPIERLPRVLREDLSEFAGQVQRFAG